MQVAFVFVGFVRSKGGGGGAEAARGEAYCRHMGVHYELMK